MSKKKNKKSAKKKVSPKPVKKKSSAGAGKKKSVKKAAKKVAKKAAPKKAASKKIKKVPVRKKPLKKAAPKKASNPVSKKVQKPTPQKAIKKVETKKPLKPVKKAAPVKESVKIVKQAAKPDPAPGPENHKAETPHVERKVVKVVKAEAVALPKKSVIIDIKTGPEPAGKFELEYVVHASSQILFEFLTTPSGLSEWFCDDVNIRNGVYSFRWEENEQNARVVKLIEEKLVRFQWVDKHDNSYFEFRIERDDLTNDISLIISDFAETPEEKASSTLLWNSQIDKLLHVLGAYF